MKKIILHIGMPKTGSTSIQKSLEGYNQGGVKYANIGPVNHSESIITVFSNQQSIIPGYRRGLSKKVVDGLAKEYHSKIVRELGCSNSTLIFSGENISNLSIRELINLNDLFSSYSNNINIIGYARDPFSFASSAFQERVKGGLGRFVVPKANYRRRFEKFFKVFGDENVQIVEFNREHFQNSSVLSDFCNRASVDQSRIKRVYANESMSETATKLLYVHNKQSKAHPRSYSQNSFEETEENLLRIPVGRILRTIFLNAGFSRTLHKGLEDPSLRVQNAKFITAIRKHFLGPSLRFPRELTYPYIDWSDVAWLGQKTGINFSAHPTLSSTKNLTRKDFETWLESFETAQIYELRSLLEKSNIPFREGDEVSRLLDRLYKNFSQNEQKHSSL